MDYEHKFEQTNKTFSFTLANKTQNQIILDSLQLLGGRSKLRLRGRFYAESGSPID